MKMNVIRIESTNISGTSKTGKPYHIDNTTVTVSVPYSDNDGFGYKEISYPYGKSSNFASLVSLRDSLPVFCDIELGAVLNQYGGVDTGISSIKMINKGA